MRRYLFLLITICVVVAIVLFAVRFERRRSFPDIPAGWYSGVARGLTEKPGGKTTFAVKRFESSNTLLFSFLEEGFQPQLVSATKYPTKDPGEDSPFEPIELQLNGKLLFLTGRTRGGEYEGSLRAGGKDIGSWHLRSAPDAEINPNENPLAGSKLDLGKWLDFKASVLSLKQELRTLHTSYEQKTEYREKLQKFVGDETLLKDRANQRRDELREQLKITQQKRTQSDEQLSSLASELDLLGRITKRGKAISLARSVENRETKWYLANWRALEDPSGIEEYLGPNAGIDLAELQASAKQATEVHALINELNKEKQRIQELEARIEELNHPPEEEQPRSPEDRDRGRKKSFWGRVFG